MATARVFALPKGVEMVGAIATALIAWIVAFVFAMENSDTNRPRSIPLAALGAFVGSVAMLVAFPKVLTVAQEQMVKIALLPWVILLLGVVLVLLSLVSHKVPTFLILVGMFVVVWAVCRL